MMMTGPAELIHEWPAEDGAGQSLCGLPASAGPRLALNDEQVACSKCAAALREEIAEGNRERAAEMQRAYRPWR